jgi:hypothetical protein
MLAPSTRPLITVGVTSSGFSSPNLIDVRDHQTSRWAWDDSQIDIRIVLEPVLNLLGKGWGLAQMRDPRGAVDLGKEIEVWILRSRLDRHKRPARRYIGSRTGARRVEPLQSYAAHEAPDHANTTTATSIRANPGGTRHSTPDTVAGKFARTRVGRQNLPVSPDYTRPERVTNGVSGLSILPDAVPTPRSSPGCLVVWMRITNRTTLR